MFDLMSFLLGLFVGISATFALALVVAVRMKNKQ